MWWPCPIMLNHGFREQLLLLCATDFPRMFVGKDYFKRRRKCWTDNIKEWTSHATTAHNGLLQKRLEKNLCWILCQVPLVTQTVTGLNWTEMKLWIWQTKIQLSLSSSHHNTVALSPAWQHQQGHFPGSSMTYMTCGALLQKHAWIVLTTPWHHPQPCSSPQGHPPGRPTWPEGCCPWQDVGPAPGSWSPGSYDIWQGQHLPTQKQDAFLD